MPRPRKAPLFELGGQWIAHEPGSPYLHRYWTEPGSRRTRRESLCTKDLEAAKRLLAEIVIKGAPKTPTALLSAVMLDYFEKRTDKLPSAKHARHACRLMLECWGDTIRAGAISEAKQKDFAEKSIAKGHSLSYVSRNLSVLAAAFAHAKLEIEVTSGKSKMRERWALQPKPPKKAFIPNDDELARILMLEEVSEDFWRWQIISLATGARPEAALELTPTQRNRDAGLTDLNPSWRPQTKKYRPTVREPKMLTAWLDRWEADMLDAARKRDPDGPEPDISNVPYVGYTSVESVQTAIERFRGGKASNTKKTAHVPKLSAYSYRHKVATVLRKAKLSEDEIGQQLGHRRPDARVTAGYGEWDPDYLTGVAAALDAWFVRLQAKVKGKSIFAEPVVETPTVRNLRRAG